MTSVIRAFTCAGPPRSNRTCGRCSAEVFTAATPHHQRITPVDPAARLDDSKSCKELFGIPTRRRRAVDDGAVFGAAEGERGRCGRVVPDAERRLQSDR